MPIPLNALFALTAAALWGGGDFSGGMGVKAAGGTTQGALRVVILAHAMSLAVLLILLAATGHAIPHGQPLLWGILAGLSAAFAITAFYIAMSRGAMGPAAAVSGLIATIIPVAVSTTIEGRPTPVHIAGFAVAAAAIWLIAAGPTPNEAAPHHNRNTMALAIFSGTGFGFYMIALRAANPLGLIEPMALSRAASLLTCTLLLWVVRKRRVPHTSILKCGILNLPRPAILAALGVAVLDTGGNTLFVAATRAGRLDVAAVLASLYPAGTILLAALYLKERPTPRQWTGMAVALAAVILITL